MEWLQMIWFLVVHEDVKVLVEKLPTLEGKKKVFQTLLEDNCQNAM